jgi:hypothetical protein
MKMRTTLVLVAAALTVAVPVAAADPDGYQPQLQGAQPDAVDRYLRNNAPGSQPDALDRYLANNAPSSPAVSTGAAGHPDSQAVRPSVLAEPKEVTADGFSFSWESAAVGALGAGLIASIAFVGASAMRERRRLVLR